MYIFGPFYHLKEKIGVIFPSRPGERRLGIVCIYCTRTHAPARAHSRMHPNAAQNTRERKPTQENSNIFQNLCDGCMKNRFFQKEKNISVQNSMTLLVFTIFWRSYWEKRPWNKVSVCFYASRNHKLIVKILPGTLLGKKLVPAFRYSPVTLKVVLKAACDPVNCSESQSWI